MLLLSRRRKESIVIDGRITITVMSVRGNVVSLGINAPRDVPVHRSEVQHRMLVNGEGAEGPLLEIAMAAGAAGHL